MLAKATEGRNRSARQVTNRETRREEGGLGWFASVEVMLAGFPLFLSQRRCNGQYIEYLEPLSPCQCPGDCLFCGCAARCQGTVRSKNTVQGKQCYCAGAGHEDDHDPHGKGMS